jgi:hypothetical protein
MIRIATRRQLFGRLWPLLARPGRKGGRQPSAAHWLLADLPWSFERQGSITSIRAQRFDMWRTGAVSRAAVSGFTGTGEIVAADRAVVVRWKMRPICAGNVDCGPSLALRHPCCQPPKRSKGPGNDAQPSCRSTGRGGPAVAQGLQGCQRVSKGALWSSATNADRVRPYLRGYIDRRPSPLEPLLPRSTSAPLPAQGSEWARERWSTTCASLTTQRPSRSA